jgi:hypothetical protein
VFILGLPGSGKSSAARYIELCVSKHSNGWSTERKNDYAILKHMCYIEKDERLYPTEDGGFNILYDSAFDEALLRLERKILKVQEESGSKDQLITIEFSRNDYSIALEKFFFEIFENFHESTYFLFIETAIDVCKERIQKRISKPVSCRSIDDHPVSEYIFERYYKRDEQRYCDTVVKRLQERFSIPDSHFQIVQNSELAEKDFQKQVGMLVEAILSEQIRARSSTLPQSRRVELEQHIAENEAESEVPVSSTKVLAEAIPA